MPDQGSSAGRSSREGEWEIAPFAANDLDEVASLLKPLWGADIKGNIRYFRWKYLSNPFAKLPAGMVARSGGRVVGFRGYFPMGIRRAYSPAVLILAPGDTVVHPDFRRRGLSVAMGRSATALYSPCFCLMLNTSCTRKSLPGYMRLGFQPLASKLYRSRYSPTGLVKYLHSCSRRQTREQAGLSPGSSGGFEIASRPLPSAMSRLAALDDAARDKLQTARTESFYAWRFNNPRQRYLFYLDRLGGSMQGFLAAGFSPDFRRAYILDLAGAAHSIKKILTFMIGRQDFNVISVPEYSLDRVNRTAFEVVGFKKNTILRGLEKRKNGEMPLLVRPVKQQIEESDWLIRGLDVRRMENWSVAGIVSDAV